MRQSNLINLRPAAPTLEEGLAFARYLDMAAEGFFGLMYGGRFEEILATAFIQPGNDFSYQHVTFATRDGIIVGMATGYTAEQQRRASKNPFREATGYSALRMGLVSLVFAPMLRFLMTHAQGDFYLQAMAVDPEVRSQGVGSILLDAMEDCARTRGSTHFCLDVSQSNEGARRLYGRRGMRVTQKWPKPAFMPCIIARMTKPLLV